MELPLNDILFDAWIFQRRNVEELQKHNKALYSLVEELRNALPEDVQVERPELMNDEYLSSL